VGPEMVLQGAGGALGAFGAFGVGLLMPLAGSLKQSGPEPGAFVPMHGSWAGLCRCAIWHRTCVSGFGMRDLPTKGRDGCARG